MVLLKFNGAVCSLEGELPPYVRAELISTLSYEDRGDKFLRQVKGYNIEPKIINLFNDGKFMTGLIPKVETVLKKHNVPIQYQNLVQPVQATPFQLPDWLRPQQVKLIENALKFVRCRQEAPTGMGKALALVYFTKFFPTANIVVVVPNKTLLHQLWKTFQENYPDETIGRVGDGKKEWCRITVGIIKSLHNAAKDNNSTLRNCQILAVDEYHEYSGSMAKCVSDYCVNTYYRTGFSATDLQKLEVAGLTGPLVHRVPKSETIEFGYNLMPKYLMIEVPDPSPESYPGARLNPFLGVYEYPTGNRKPDPEAVEQVAVLQNNQRNQLIADCIQIFHQSEFPDPGLCMVRRIDHGLEIQRLLALKGIEVDFLTGANDTKERNKVIQELRDRTRRFVIVSSIFNRGVDITSIGFAILADCSSGGEEMSMLRQRVGRVDRKGSTDAIILDFEDLEHYYLRARAAKRIKAMEETYPGCLRRIKLADLKDILNGKEPVSEKPQKKEQPICK